MRESSRSGNKRIRIGGIAGDTRSNQKGTFQQIKALFNKSSCCIPKNIMLDINTLNSLSRQLCQATSEQERQVAEQTLNSIVESDDCLQHCLLLLERGEQPYSVVVANGALKKLLSRKVGINISDRLELSRYLLKYMVDRINSLSSYNVVMLCKTFALLTKNDKLPFQEPIYDLLSTSKNTTKEGCLALKLLNTLIEEVNSDEGLDSISRQRKIASDLRDVCLVDVFTLSLDILKEPSSGQITGIQAVRVGQALDLAFACMNYDFIGSMNDETLDENINIQVPTKWRPLLMERQLASVRRMLFDASDRQKYLDQLVSGLKLVLDNPAKLLKEPDNFHQFCRLVSRLKANYQVSELLKCQDFPSVLPLLTQFTLESLLHPDWCLSQNSIYYLLSFWSRMAGSLSYARVDVESIAESVPQVCAAFIQSRIRLCELVVREGVEDPLDDSGTLKQLMELFTIQSKDSAGSFGGRKRLIWIITMMAAGVNGKTASNSCDVDDDIFDGEVVSRVWKLMKLTDANLQAGRADSENVQLEFAYLYLLDEFRKAYISDQIQRESRVYEKLSQEVGVADDSAALKLYAMKIITNLQYWGKNEKLLSTTLALLNDLTVGFANVRRLLKTDEIKQLLENHSTFEFVCSNTDVQIIRSRTSFYAALTRLLNVELEEDTTMFDMFMKPIGAKLQELCVVFRNRAISQANQQHVRLAVIGLCRDLRGIASSCSKKANFVLLLNWTLPEVFVVLQGAIALWPNVADVTTPILKLIAELTLNRQSRLTYDMHSCVSVILFREVSKIICDYGGRLLALPEVSKDQHYKEKWQLFTLRSLWIYGDNCLNNSLDIAFKLFVHLQQENVLAYSKLSQSLYYWLDIVTRDNMAYVSKLDEAIFISLLKSVHRGILSVDTTVISSSCTILDQILDYLFERSSRQPSERVPITREPEGNNCMTALEKEPDLLYDLLVSILSQLLFEEVKCQWSMSRPLLGLIIANGPRFNQWREEFISRQPLHSHTSLAQAFTKLMDGIKENVSLKNKDNFTQSLSSFRKKFSYHIIETVLKGSSSQTTADSDFADNQFMTD
uniref:Exportin-7/Ran-binding protein 17 TPR repeats domain-containing protein n=1 Tax=Ditylenchus dipsaci TaxID=166011 RepID=A0A915D4X1_9BILA